MNNHTNGNGQAKTWLAVTTFLTVLLSFGRTVFQAFRSEPRRDELGERLRRLEDKVDRLLEMNRKENP